ncbi:MAG: ABC transporter ATP-binding protein [Candidatus Hydrogenedentes bacterium]|nr:ABC transporter ATP-binding protein [Candidatus Hydrogenedentota bacterium]
MSLLSVDNVTIRFGGLTAVNEVDLQVERGQIFSVIGPNGAGKTTVFNVITGVYEPTCGCVRIDGRSGARPVSLRTVLGIAFITLATAAGFVIALNIRGLWDATVTANYVFQEAFPWGKSIGDAVAFFRELPWTSSMLPALAGGLVGFAGAVAVWRRARCTPDVIACGGIARTFQNPRLFHQMSVLENVLVGMDTKFRSRFWHAALRLPLFFREYRGAEAKAMELLKFVELDDDASAPAASLSYGHQRRLEIARALASEPKLLLLDEPAAGMNPSESDDLMVLIRKIRERGVSVMLIEHHMDLVMEVSDRIAVLDYGNKIAEGTPDEVQANPKVRKAYLGTEDA